MRVLSSVAALSLGLVVSTGAWAVTGEEAQLIDSINVYRSKAQPCGGEASLELPPLNSDTRLALSPEGTRDLQQAMTRGFHAARLGPRVLRTETAPVVALSVAQQLWGDF